MDWATIITLIISQGLPVAEKLWQLFSKNAPPTQEDWNALLALGKVNARQQMMMALARNGIDPNSPEGQSFLALTPA